MLTASPLPHQVWQTPRAGQWGPCQAHCGREDGAEEVSLPVLCWLSWQLFGRDVLSQRRSWACVGVHTGISWQLILFACVFPLPAAPSPPSWGPGWTSTRRISASPPTLPASSSSSPTCATTSPAPTWSAGPASCWPSSSSKSRARPRQKVGSSPGLKGSFGAAGGGDAAGWHRGPPKLEP